ncbi:hypothetical protein ACO03V_06905 [Microbacterium sp. HMH0099]|uniref:hypothetical protein n=1 Tax=Microbacterium TaxID=33882 RepID=UPI001F9A47A2|nr:hypothetical protein [Actinomycetota bacterium]
MSLDSDATTRTELLWVGDGGWCICDAARDDDDPHRVLAFAQCRDHVVDVTWVRTPRPPERFETLREALLAVERATGRL